MKIQITEVPPGTLPKSVLSGLLGISLPYDETIQGDLRANGILGYDGAERGYVVKTKDIINALRSAHQETEAQFWSHVPDKFFRVPARCCRFIET